MYYIERKKAEKKKIKEVIYMSWFLELVNGRVSGRGLVARQARSSFIILTLNHS